MLITIKLVRHIDRFVEIYNVSILIQYFFFSIIYLVVEVIASTFPAIITVFNWVILFCISLAISLSFFQCIKIGYKIDFYRIIPIYLKTLHI